jgi:hypothetical protein
MDWPWVSRWRLNLAEARADWYEEMYSLELAERRRLGKLLAEAESRYRDLVHSALQMRREGFQPPMPILESAIPDGLAIDVEAAIVAVAGEVGPLHEQITRTAYQRVKQGWSTEAIVKEVYDGENTDNLLG